MRFIRIQLSAQLDLLILGKNLNKHLNFFFVESRYWLISNMNFGGLPVIRLFEPLYDFPIAIPNGRIVQVQHFKWMF